MENDIYIQGKYYENNPTWHIEDSAWKAQQIIKIIKKNNLKFKTVSEIGCGGGEILKQLQINLNEEIEFTGYDISPQAYELCKNKNNKKLNFRCQDILADSSAHYDLILLIDVIEHIEDCFGFLRNIKTKSNYKILHIPLDLSVQSIFRSKPIIDNRELVGHIHYYTKELALHFLKDAGFQIIDYFYTGSSTELALKSMKAKLLRIPRKICFSINQDLTARILGGYSLLVLAT